jgi:hypothetical protein
MPVLTVPSDRLGRYDCERASWFGSAFDEGGPAEGMNEMLEKDIILRRVFDPDFDLDHLGIMLECFSFVVDLARNAVGLGNLCDERRYIIQRDAGWNLQTDAHGVLRNDG